MEDLILRAEAKIRELADEYAARGFEVIVDPAPSQLPPFLAGYRPDLLVRREGQSTIVEVKPRRSLSIESGARQIAGIIQERPDWNFELVTLDERPSITPPGADAFEDVDIRHHLKEAGQLSERGHVRPSLLIAWAAFEAALRLAVESEGIVAMLATPGHLMKLAAAEGLISRKDYRNAAEIMRQRNALAHGYREPEVSLESVRRLIDISEQLLSEMSSPTSV